LAALVLWRGGGETIDDAVFHHKVHLGGGFDIGNGIPRHGDDVGEFAGASAPRSLWPSSSAATLVPAFKARTELNPALTIARNSRMPWLNGNTQSVP
jgi:hypothetical protein